MEISKERFLEAKAKVTKKYKGAYTKMDPQGKYYISTKEGKDICNLPISSALSNFVFDKVESFDYEDNDNLEIFNKILDQLPTIPHSNSIKEAWMKAEVAIQSHHIVNRNSEKFSDNKAKKEALKDFEE